MQPKTEVNGNPAIARQTIAATQASPQTRTIRRRLSAFARVCRFDIALALTTPAWSAACVVWWQTSQVDWLALAFTLTATFAIALGIHLLSESYDFAHSRSVDARLLMASPETPFGLLMQHEFNPGLIASLGYLMFTLAALCMAWLVFLVGWPMLLFIGIALALGIGYAVPPLRYGARGWGLGESGLFLALGVLPALASYYAQARAFEPLYTWSGLPFALLTALIVVNSAFVNYRRDWLMRKKTLAVLLGPPHALDLSTLLVILPFIVILFGAVVTHLPLRTMIALAALPIAFGVYSDVDRQDLTAEMGNRLFTVAGKATLAAGLLYCLALFSDRLW